MSLKQFTELLVVSTVAIVGAGYLIVLGIAVYLPDLAREMDILAK